ncbi:MAG: TIGR04255 family protein [Gemmatimonadaceae bacterium]
MPFPESQRVVFEKNPLTQVIAQIQFPPILSILAEAPAAFQDRLRDQYPLYAKSGGLELPTDLAALMQRLNVTRQLQPVQQHSFSTADGARTVTLTRDFLAIEDTEYERWEGFIAELDRARAALEDIYEPAFYTRIGLRYVDVLDRAVLGLPTEPWSSLLNPALVGVIGDPALRDDVSELATAASIRLNQVKGGTVRLQHGLKVPDNGEATQSSPVYVIDADFFTQERSSPADVRPALDAFNHLAGNLFRWAITPVLRDALGPVPIP